MTNVYEQFMNKPKQNVYEQFMAEGGDPQYATETVSTAEDAARSLATGVRTGVEGTAGTLGDIRQVAENVADAVTPDDAPDWVKKAARVAGPASLGPLGFFAPTTEQVQKVTDWAVGPERHQPQTTAGKYARTVGEFAPGALVGSGGVVKKGLTQVVAPAVASEFAGQLAEGTKFEPWARLAGAIFGTTAPSVVGRAVSPLPISKSRQKALNVLKKEGVDLTAGQKTGSDIVRYAESEIGGAAARNVTERQAEQFTKAALKRIGVNANRATPEVMDQAFDTLGNGFKTLSQRNNLVKTRTFNTKITNALNEYVSNTPESLVIPKVRQLVDDMVSMKNRVPGAFYQNARSQIGKHAQTAWRQDPERGKALSKIVDTLDDAMEQTIRRRNPSDLGEWRKLRRKYRNILVVEDALSKAGEQAVSGLITPTNLRMAAASKHGKRNYVRGKGDFNALARAGYETMKAMPQSGTAPRAAVRGAMNVPTALGAAGGAMYGQSTEAALAGAALGYGVPYVAGKALMSPLTQGYLANQLAAPLADMGPSTQSALIAALLSRNAEARPLPAPSQ